MYSTELMGFIFESMTFILETLDYPAFILGCKLLSGNQRTQDDYLSGWCIHIVQQRLQQVLLWQYDSVRYFHLETSLMHYIGRFLGVDWSLIYLQETFDNYTGDYSSLITYQQYIDFCIDELNGMNILSSSECSSVFLIVMYIWIPSWWRLMGSLLITNSPTPSKEI